MYTQKTAFDLVRRFGFVAKRTEGGDLMLNYPRGKESTAYYTNDLRDLVDTARSWQQRDAAKALVPVALQKSADRFDCGPDEWEERCVAQAAYFTTFRQFSGRHRRDVRKFDDIEDALRDARHDDRALVYAVTAQGRQACLERSRWQRFREIRKQSRNVQQ